MNQLQTQIYQVILAIIRIEEFPEYYKDHTIRYGVLNYVAKYSLAKDEYLISKRAFEHLKLNSFLKQEELRRGLKSRRNGFTYEHPIPSNRISSEIEYRELASPAAAVTTLKVEPGAYNPEVARLVNGLPGSLTYISISSEMRNSNA